MAPKLHPKERVIYEGRPSWRSILGFYARGIAITIAVAFIAAVSTALIGGSADAALVVAISLAGVAATFLGGFLKRAGSRYTITDQRLHIRRGIVTRTVQETRIERVQNVNYRQTIGQRLLGVGDVDFDTASGHEYEFTFAGVAAPARVVETVNGATTRSDSWA